MRRAGRAKTSRAPATTPASRDGSMSTAGRSGSRAHPGPDDERGRGERGRVDEQGQARAEEPDGGAPRREAEDLRELVGGDRHRGPHHVPVAGQHVGIDRRARRGERRSGQRDQEEQHDQSGQGHAGYGHDQDERPPDEVAGDHHEAARVPVGEPGQRHAADERRHDAGHEGDRGEQSRTGAVVDEHGQRDTSKLITDNRQELSRPQSPELRHREYVAEGRRGLLGCTPPGHRVSSYLVLRLSEPLRSSVITS